MEKVNEIISEIIDEVKIYEILKKTKKTEKDDVLKILDKALEKKGLDLVDVGYLLNIKDLELIDRLFEVASLIKQEIYGERLVFFAPLYISNYCVNDCCYCGFHKNNKISRKKLTLDEVEEQVRILVDMGHKRLLLEFGEDSFHNTIDYVVEVIKKIYSVKSKNGEIRRVNVNIASTIVEDYRKLKKAGIGTYQLFQETYHKNSFEKVHDGPKADYNRQLFSHDKAFEAGIDDVGLGVLFGLYDYKFEVLGLLSHSKYLEKKFGVGPHTISVPRFQPALSVDFIPEYLLSDYDLLKVIAILRLAVPYTGIIISTRESPEIRKKAFKIGISQTSAASRTSPGGYGDKNELNQFNISDDRSLGDVLKGILDQGLLPSFCTACYRKDRTGKDFMELAKPGDIQELCRPNAILTFKEFLEDYGSLDIRDKGLEIIEKYLNEISDKKIRDEVVVRLREIEKGKRDLYF